jgi:hypothetical protein
MPGRQAPAGEAVRLRVGDRVEVRSAEEILATLDQRGERDSLPFMPEMLRFCGREFTVDKVAHKLCDTIGRSGFRRMDNAVHLSGVRCDGRAHGGCQASCLIYWKTDWLKRADPAVPVPAGPASPSGDRRLLPLLTAASRGQPAPDGAETYRCQATELLRAAPEAVPARDLRQHVRDVRSGEVGVLWSLRALLVALFNRYQEASRRVLPRWLWIRRGLRWGFLRGGAAGLTPTARTDLRPGELVRVRPKQEILKTLTRTCTTGVWVRCGDDPVLRPDRPARASGGAGRRRADRPDDPHAAPEPGASPRQPVTGWPPISAVGAGHRPPRGHRR